MIRTSKTFFSLSLILLILLGSGALGNNQSYAQGTATINITGIPPLLPSPQISELVTGYETGRYTMQVLFTSPRQFPAEFRLKVGLALNGSTILETVSDPFSLLPGVYFYNRFNDIPEIPFATTLSNLISQMPSGPRDAALLGLLREGLYRLTLELIPGPQDQGIISLPANAFFSVQYAQPPILFSPPNQSVVTLSQPVFSWTPVIVPPQYQIRYELIIAEIIGSQTPLQAIEGALFPMVRTELDNQTIFIYTPENLPLEFGKTYAWQVTATDVDGSFPFVDNGRSQIQVFSYEKPGGIGEDLMLLSEIIIEPGFARIYEFSNATVTEDPIAYRLNGPATLELIINGQPLNIEVGLEDFQIQKTGLENPVVFGGGFKGSASLLAQLFDPEQGITPETLNWVFGSGITLSAMMLTPNHQKVLLEGNLRLTAAGLSGELRSVESPVLVAEADGQRIEIREITVSYPGGIKNFDAVVSLFSDGLNCRCDIFEFTAESVSAFIECDDMQTITFSEERPGLSLKVNHGTGTLVIGWDQTLREKEIQINGDLMLDVPGLFDCSINATLLFTNDDVQILSFTPNCTQGSGINIGFGDISLGRFRLGRISWDKELGWDAEIETDGDIELPFDDDEAGSGRRALRLPTRDGIVIHRDGIRLPQMELTEDELASSPGFSLGRYKVKPRRFRMPEKEFPWREVTARDDSKPNRGKPNDPGSWDFDLDGDVEFEEDTQLADDPSDPTDPGKIQIPECLRNAPIRITNARFANGRFSATASKIFDTPCSVPLTAFIGYEKELELIITELAIDVNGGMSAGRFSTQVAMRSTGKLISSNLLICETGDEIARGTFNLDPYGRAYGSMNTTPNNCKVDLSPFDITLTEGLVEFDFRQKREAILTAGVVVVHSGSDGIPRTATGTTRIDLIKPEILELDVVIEGPYELDIPKENPVLRFVLNRLQLNKEGYRVNGSQSLKVGNTSIGATFEEVFFKYNHFAIADGRVRIDGNFTLLAQLEASGQTKFGLAPHGQIPTGMAGAAFHLSGPVFIDSSGVVLSGLVRSSLLLAGIDLPELDTHFSNDFRIETDPFRVEEGIAELRHEGSRIAWLDRDGLQPDPIFFANIRPRRILLPVEQVAYIDLVDENDEYLINLEQLPNGHFRLENRPGSQPRLTVPALQGNRPEAPTYPFVFNNVVIDPMTMSLVQGSIIVDFPELQGVNLTDLGIPLNMRRLIFGELPHNGIPLMGFFIEGDLNLFDAPLPANGYARLLVMTDGTIEGYVELEGDNTFVNLNPEGNVRIAFDTMTGYIFIPRGNAAQARWDINLNGELQVNIPGVASANAKVAIRAQHTGVSVSSDFTASHEIEGETPCSRDGSNLRIDKINSFSLSWDSQNGFDFYANTDITFCAYSVEETFSVPLSGVAMTKAGFHIPEQEKHRHSQPPLNLPTATAGGVNMKPIAIRVPETNITWANINSANYSAFLPRFDFEITFPGFEERAPQIAAAKLTMVDAGITDGILSGLVLPYTFPGDGVEVPLASPAQNPPVLVVKTIGGGIRRVETPNGPEQKYEFTFDGKLRNLAKFNSDDCVIIARGENDPGNDLPSFTDVDPQFTFTYLPPMGLEAVLTDVKPCGSFVIGPVTIVVEESVLTFRYENGEQQLFLDGEVGIMLPHPEREGELTTIAGTLGLDLMNGTIRSGSVEITEPFRWYYPDEASKLFIFQVNRARLDTEGIRFSGDAGLRVGEETIPIRFEDFLYEFEREKFVGGRTLINSAFAIEIELADALEARLVNPQSPFTATNAMRLSAQANMVLDAEGLKLTGTSTAAFRLGDNDYPSLTVIYQPDEDGPFTLAPAPGAMPPVRVVRGRADLMLENSRVAYFDKDGFHLDNILALLPIPERIGLPTENIAYLDTRVGDTDIPVEAQRTDNGYIVRTKPGRSVNLFFTGLDRNNPPRAAVTFEVQVDDAFRITGGEIEADITDNPIDLMPFTNLPIDLVKVRYKSADDIYRLEADARLKLPGELGTADVLVEELTFDENGFRQLTFSAGTYTETADPSLPELHTITFGQGNNEQMQIMGVRIAFGQTNSLAFSGFFSSTFLMDRDQPVPAPTEIFYTANWQGAAGSTPGSWSVGLGVDENRDIPIGDAKLALEEIGATLDNNGFEMVFTGRLSVPDLMGASFMLRVEDLTIGSRGVGLKSGTFTGEHNFSLYNDIVDGRITRLTAEIDSDRVLYLSGDGWISLWGNQMTITNMGIGSNGTFTLDQADLLPGDARIDIIEDVAWLETLQLSVQENRLKLTSGGSVVVPEPLDATTSIALDLSYDSDGNVVIDGPRIDLIIGSPGNDYQLGSHPSTEVQVGDLAKLALTGLALDVDLYDISRSKFYSTALLFIENDNSKRLRFGDSGNIREEPGIFVQYGEPLQWNLASQGPNLFSFDTGFFRLQVDGVRTFNPTVFGVAINGKVGLVIGGNGDILKGSTSFTDLRIAMPANPQVDPNPIVKLPEITSLTVTLMDIFSLQLGTFDIAQNQTVMISEGNKPDSISERPVQVKHYLRFYNPNPGSPAVSISLTEAFSGGVDEVMIYQDIDDNFLLYIKNANLSLGGVGSLSVSFRMETGANSLTLQAAGGGRIEGLGAIAAAGKFGVNSRRELSFGVFLAVQSNAAIPLIPPAPPAVGLMGIGGGLFFRPEQSDLDNVIDAVREINGELADLAAQRLPPTSSSFAVMAYAGVSIASAGTISALDGHIFMELTDRYVSMSVLGVLAKQEGKLSGGLNATLNWSTLNISGLLTANINYAPALTGNGRLGFNIAVQGNPARVLWVVDGDFEAKIVAINANGNLTVSPSGFFAAININANFPSPIISFDGNFDGQVWMIPNPQRPLDSELGAYARLEMTVSAFGGLATASTLAEGTFIYKNQTPSLFLLGMLNVNVAFVFEGSVFAYLEFQDNELKAADLLFEVDQKLLDAIGAARQLGDKMNQESQKTVSAVREASNTISQRTLDPILAQAGVNLFMMPSSGLFGEIVSNARMTWPETFLYTPYNFESVPGHFQFVFNEIRYGERKPAETSVLDAESRMKTLLNDASSFAPGVINTINENRALALQWTLESSLSFQRLTSPLGSGGRSTTSIDGISIESTLPFTVNEQQASAFAENLSEASDKIATFADLEPEYFRAIQTATDNLSRLNTVLRGVGGVPGVIEQGRRFSLARQGIGEYYARRTDYFHELQQWATTKQQLLYSQAGNVQGAIDHTVRTYTNMNRNTAIDRCDQARAFLNFSAIERAPACGDRYELAQLIAMARKRTVLELSGASTTDVRVGVRTYSTQLTNLRTTNQINAFNALYFESGAELWYDIYDQGLIQITRDAADKIASTNTERNTALNEINPSDREFTRSLDSLYLLRAQMTENLYSMIDAYLEARAGSGMTMSDTRVRNLTNQRTQLANSLLPPIISAVNVTAEVMRDTKQDYINGRLVSTHKDRNFSRARITWSASHPTRVVEYSLGIRYRRTVTASQVYSVGNLTSFNHWVHKGYTEGALAATSPSTFFLLLRARGEAGYTASRTMSFQVPVEGNSDWYTGFATRTNSALPAITALPAKPAIALMGAIAAGGTTDIPAFWWTDTQRLNLEMVSSDSGTGIQKFEIAIGSQAGTQNILPWTTITGVRTTTGSSVKIEAVHRNLNLPQGTAGSFVQVRAVNGANLISDVSQIRVMVDDTPPSRDILYTPTAGTLLQPGPNQTNPATHSVRLPPYSDPQSGLSRLEYIVSSQRINPVSRFESGSHLTAGNAALLSLTPSFRDSSFVYVRALNRAGLYTDITVLAYKTRDITLPPVPAITVEQVINGLALVVNSDPTDPETGLLGMQFALGIKPGMFDLRDWPSGATIDFMPGTAIKGTVNGRKAVYYFISNNNLPLGTEFFVFLRNINGQNVPSLILDAGPFMINQIPPDFFNISFNPTGDKLSIGGFVEDRAGVTSVRYRIMDKNTGTILQEGDLYNGSPGNSINLSAILTVPKLSGTAVVRISLFAENIAGLSRAIHQEIIQVTP